MSTFSLDTTVAFAADHGGAELKNWLIQQLDSRNGAINCGVDGVGLKVDIQDYVIKAAGLIASGKANRAVMVCRSGHMASIVANRFSFIRAAVCHSPEDAAHARAHNDCNVLCLPADFINADMALETLHAFLVTPASDEPRYTHRRSKLLALDTHQFDHLFAKEPAE